jgi:hypothetical protein
MYNKGFVRLLSEKYILECPRKTWYVLYIFLGVQEELGNYYTLNSFNDL